MWSKCEGEHSDLIRCAASTENSTSRQAEPLPPTAIKKKKSLSYVLCPTVLVSLCVCCTSAFRPTELLVCAGKQNRTAGPIDANSVTYEICQHIIRSDQPCTKI